MSAADPTRGPRKVIVTCAVTGAVHVPSMTPYLPVTPEEIARQAIDAARAGAAIVHLHARDPQTGEPTGDPEVFARFVPQIAEETDAIINLTTGGAQGMTLDERIAAASRFSPELCTLSMGSMNFGLFPMADRIESFQHEWEPRYLRGTKDSVFRNTFWEIERLITELGAGGTRFECECYDVGHLYNLAFIADRGLIQPPFFIQAVFGALGGIGAEADQVLHMKRTADRLFGDDFELSMLAAGRRQMELITLGAILGSNVRVGMEDSIYIGPGSLAKSNAEQVEKVVRILQELSLEPASPDEARRRLGLKGRDRTGAGR